MDGSGGGRRRSCPATLLFGEKYCLSAGRMHSDRAGCVRNLPRPRLRRAPAGVTQLQSSDFLGTDRSARWKAGRGGFMRRFLTLGFLVVFALPAGITFSGCYRNPAGNYCNGLGYGLKDTDVYAITLQPETTGISMAFGQTRQIAAPSAVTCKNAAASVTSYTYGTTNNRLVDISPSGSMCAGTWNRNSGGGIADYTICQNPNPLPDTGGLPYSVAYITATANSVTSNPVAVYVHAQV